MSETKSVLRGQSRNTSTTCTRQKGTGGPEELFLLKLKERATVELEVVSGIDTVIAVRRTCDDPLSEVACSDDPGLIIGSRGEGAGGSGGAAGSPTGPIPAPPPPPPPPGAVPARPTVPPPPTRDGFVRVALDPGAYFVLVDEAEPFGVGGEFTLKVRAFPPPAHVSCKTPLDIRDGTRLDGEELDLAIEKEPPCSGTDPRPALYYKAAIPAGQRLTVRAAAIAGDQIWTPVMQLFSACSGSMCLATGRATPQGEQVLRYVNNGTALLEALVSISASAPVHGGVFHMNASTGEPLTNASCETARQLTDGIVLRNQDLSEGQTSAANRCRPTGGQSLFYKATLLERQSLSGFVMAAPTSNLKSAPLFVTWYEGCAPTNCQGGAMGDRFGFQNMGPGTKTMTIEVSNFPGAPVSAFDMMVSIPPPPPQSLP